MTHTKPSLFKQILGAVAGSAIALGIYGAYTVVKPTLQGYLTLPFFSDGVRTSDTVSDNDMERRVARAQQLTQAFAVSDTADVAEDMPDSESATNDIADLFPAARHEVAQAPLMNDVPTEPMVQAQVTSSAASHAGAPALPSSGVGAGALALVAGVGSAAYRRFRRTRAASGHSVQ